MHANNLELFYRSPSHSNEVEALIDFISVHLREKNNYYNKNNKKEGEEVILMDGRVIDPAGTRPTALCVCVCVCTHETRRAWSNFSTLS